MALKLCRRGKALKEGKGCLFCDAGNEVGSTGVCEDVCEV